MRSQFHLKTAHAGIGWRGTYAALSQVVVGDRPDGCAPIELVSTTIPLTIPTATIGFA
jgi:hypothetical protein